MKAALIVGLLAAGLATGSAITYVALSRSIATADRPTGSGAAGPAAAGAPGTAASGGNAAVATGGSPASVTLSPEAIERAHIVTRPVETARIASERHVPATIEANAYKQVVVTAIAGGRITRVAVELGQRVRRGATLVELYSPELADAQRAFISAQAELRAHEQQLARTERLVQIGAASAQELERTHAEHTMMTTAVEGARSKLELFGVPANQIAGLTQASAVAATISVRAPLDGVITARQVNAGVNVEAGAPLLTVVDLSTVWAVGALYEQDAAAVHDGTPARVVVAGGPELRGVVSYIDPAVSADTRATRVRVELPNAGGALRLGMYADLVLESAAARDVPVVPKSAVQTVGSGSVVYVADPRTPGRFVERTVQTGADDGTRVEIASGVQPGEQVVVEGSFFVRAERERLGPAGSGSGGGSQAVGSVGPQTARVMITAKGFEPDRVTLAAGRPARITFVRTTDATCATEIAFPSLNVRRPLPLNEPVDVDFTPERGEVPFACGMNMLKGTVTGR